MGQTLRVVAGADGGPWNSTLLGEDGQAVEYPDDATFEATVSRGGDEASLFTPSVAWISAVSGTFSVAVAASDTATLDPGVYAMQVFVLFGGDRHTAFDGHLEILPTVGTATARAPYCKGSDLRRWYDQINTLSNSRSDSTEYLDVRVEIASLFDRKLVERLQPSGGYTLVRHNAPHPILGILDYADPSAVPPSKADLTDALAAGGLVLERKVVEMTTLWCLAEILERQQVVGKNDYREEADRFRARFEEMWHCYQAQVDLSSTDYVQKATYPMALVARNVVLLPEDTAP